MAGPSGATPILQLPYPTPDDNVDVPRDVQALADAIDDSGLGYAAPAGAILMWPTSSPPTGWLLCDGQVVSAAQYPKLAQVLTPSGGNITLPNFTGRFPAAPGQANQGTVAEQASNGVVGAGGGKAKHGLGASELPKHTHGPGNLVTDQELNHSHVINEAAAAGASWGDTSAIYAAHSGTLNGQHVTTQGAGQHGHLITGGNTGDGGAALGGLTHENRPPFLVVNFIIRAM